MHTIVYSSPVGILHLTANDAMLTRVATTAPNPALATDAVHTPVLVHAVRELSEYFAGERTRFTVPYQLTTAAFYGRVQQHLAAIPHGQTRTYLDIARDLRNPGATRAVGSACATNPLLIILPCHRVIKQDGGLGVYAGGMQMKRDLLQLEAA